MSLESFELQKDFFDRLKKSSGLTLWNFETERHFGPKYREVKDTMRVTVLPLTPGATEPLEKLRYTVF